MIRILAADESASLAGHVRLAILGWICSINHFTIESNATLWLGVDVTTRAVE